MAFVCRICREKFSMTKLLTDPTAVSAGYSVVSTQCGHLFHLKCFEGALTNQKLLHMKHGTGPLRRFCPVGRCNADIKSEESVIRIALTEDESSFDEESPEAEEGKLLKRIQSLMSEKDKLLEGLQKSDTEVELLQSVLDEIKLDLSEVQSFLKDDQLLKKGDLIFWITKDGAYIPGKVLEIRKKPGEIDHYAIVKLDKAKSIGNGPCAANRDTLILPVSELITFKSFFCEFFDKFQSRFESLVMDLTWEMQDLGSPTGSHSSADRSAAYYKSTRKISRSTSKQSFGLNSLDELDSSVSVESVPVASVRRNSQPAAPKAQAKVSRSRTIHYGEGNRPRRLEKCRSKSWANPPTRPLLDSPNETLELELELNEKYMENQQQNILRDTGSDLHNMEEEEEENEMPKDFIAEGERVIWFDNYSEYEQVGTVAAVCEYSPCAIVHFDEHPYVKHKFQYRTVPLDELFPYDLASTEDKLRLAEMYGKILEFVESRQHFFSISNDESTSTSECEEIVGLSLDFDGGIKVDTKETI